MLNFITRYFSKEDLQYKDDFDGRFKYTAKKNILPNMVRRILGLAEARYDRRKRRFGRIKANPLYYITVPMIFVFMLVLYAAVASFTTLVEYFNTNIYLNGLIISLMLFAILKTFHNSFVLYGTALFIRKIEKVMYKDKVEPEDIIMLRASLERQGELVNTIYMVQTIDNVEQFGHPNFNDMRSRLIKSKLGRRVAKKRGDVNFIAGILVMLGLLGTFLGLLATIDAVGDAMNSMSNIGGESGEIGVEEMGGFISSLAAPLQGMGLAFSSSLFGLSGSLLIGFFLHLSGTPQNEFIENLSRWIDDREQKFDPNPASNSKAKVPAKDADLKDWLAGYIHLTTKTNKHLSDLSDNIGQNASETARAWNEIQGLANAQMALHQSAHEIGENIQVMRQQGDMMASAVPQLVGSIDSSRQAIADKMDGIRQDSSAISAHMQDNNQLVKSYVANGTKGMETQSASVNEIRNLLAQSNVILDEVANLNKRNVDKEAFEMLRQDLISLETRQAEVMAESRDLLRRLQSDPHMEQAQDLVKQLESLLQQMNKRARMMFARKKKKVVNE